MKKIIKKAFAGLMTATLFMTSAISVSAMARVYDLENEKYRSYVDNLTMDSRVEEVTLRVLPKGDEDFHNAKHIYIGRPDIFAEIDIHEDAYTEIIYEYGDDTTRFFSDGHVIWNVYSYNNNNSFPAKEELVAFLEDNDMKAELDEMFDSGSFSLSYDEDADIDDVLDICVELFDEYGICPFYYMRTTAKMFSDPVATVTPTLAGDADLNGECGIADVALITKYTASSELYPIDDPTALANADINQDSEVNAADVGVLIEIMLGNYESAV